MKALTSTYHIRTASHERDVRIPLSEVEIAHFSSLVLPLILKTKDVEALFWILRQDEILLRGYDFYSFVVYAIRENWLQGLKIFLNSSTAVFFFTNLPFVEQAEVVARLVDHALLIQDVKQRKLYFT